MTFEYSLSVMAGLVPAIHEFLKDLDAWNKSAHDDFNIAARA